MPPAVGEWRGFEAAGPSIRFDKRTEVLSPYIKSRVEMGYFSPEEYYETLVDRLITSSTRWLDVGCGKAPFPNNFELSRQLSERCAKLVGVDPDEQSIHNDYVHECHQTTLEGLPIEETFDVITARMVVEHVRYPDSFASALARSTHGGSLVAVLTVNWYSVTAFAAHFTPFAVHKLVKAGLWGTKSEDSFPTEYLLNRRRDLRLHMEKSGFEELFFQALPDASLFWRIAMLRHLELQFFRLIRSLRVPYPETCLLALYRRRSN